MLKSPIRAAADQCHLQKLLLIVFVFLVVMLVIVVTIFFVILSAENGKGFATRESEDG